MDNMLVTSGYHVDNHSETVPVDITSVRQMSRSVQGASRASDAKPARTGRVEPSLRKQKGVKAAKGTTRSKSANKSAQKPVEKAFHHGDLKSALVREASRLIAERGEADFSLRELAEMIGVTHPAVYRHFKAKADLLSEIALQGFAQLEAALATQGRFGQVLRAYMFFAREKPGFYRAMFHPMLRDSVAFAAVDQAMERLRGRFALNVPEAFGWSTAHGLAMLVLDGRLNEQACDTALAYDVAAKQAPRRSAPKKAPVPDQDVANLELAILQLDQSEIKKERLLKAAKAVKRPAVVDNTPSLFDFMG